MAAHRRGAIKPSWQSNSYDRRISASPLDGSHRLDTLAGGASSDGRFWRIATRSILPAVSVAPVDPLQTAARAHAAGAGRAVIFVSSTSFAANSPE
jgi:hypothetical protein